MHLAGARASLDKSKTTTTFTCSTGRVDDASIREQRPGEDHSPRAARPSNGDAGYALPKPSTTAGGDAASTVTRFEKICPGFENSANDKRHTKIHEPNVATKYACSVCFRGFRHKGNLQVRELGPGCDLWL